MGPAYKVFFRSTSGLYKQKALFAEVCLLGRACRGLDGTAWKMRPSWYVLATKDRTVHPELQRFVAKRMGATIIEVVSSHVAMLSKPSVVLDVIRLAVGAVQKA
jgi:hypothetical protein